jgi:two-component system, NtrC family, sensor histidine kinase HydH
MTGDRIRGFYARVGLLATTIALAVALVVGSWLNYRGAQAAVATLNVGQLDLIEVQLREAFHPWDPAPDSAALQRFIDSHPESGVRYIALLDPTGEVISSAGSPAMPAESPRIAPESGPGARLVQSGDRVRGYVARPTAHGARPAAGPPTRPQRFAFNIVEFEPIVATTLVAGAYRSLVLGALAAALLTFAALGFWRNSVRFEAQREQIERQRRLSQLGEMSAVLAHEIRNPLASLKGNAQLLAEGLLSETRERRRADRVVNEAVRLQALTADLLDFARSGPIEHRTVDPVELLRTAAGEVADASVRIESHDAPTRWILDPERIRQALVNLLRNAAQVSPPDHPPVARITQEAKNLVFRIRDFGPGLLDDENERIFEPFYTTRTNGTGLGLAVARRVVELHGGRLEATNHPGGGAEFRIVIPRTES